MTFLEWCEQDIKDETLIDYTLYVNGKKEEFTSDDEMPSIYLLMLRKSKVESIDFVDGRWKAVLHYL